MQEAGVTVTDQIGDGPDTITLSNEFGDSLVLSGEFSVDAKVRSTEIWKKWPSRSLRL